LKTWVTEELLEQIHSKLKSERPEIGNAINQVLEGWAQGSYVREKSKVLTTDSPPTASMLIKSLKAGLPMTELTALRASLDLPTDRLAPMLG
jgi:hypothetical protein